MNNGDNADNSLFRKILDSMSTGLVMFSPDGIIKYANARFDEIFQSRSGNFLGISINSLLTFQDADENADGAINWLNRDFGVSLTKIKARCKDGSEVPIELTLSMAEENAQKLIVGEVRELSPDDTASPLSPNGEHILEEIINGCPVPLFVIDGDHRVSHWNRAAEAIIGGEASELIGTRQQGEIFYGIDRPVLADAVMDHDHETISTLYAGKFAASPLVKNAYEATDFFPNFPSGPRWLYFTAAPLHGVDGKIVGAVETLQDVTFQKETEESLQKAVNEADEASHAKSDFLAGMSHELRTPLNAIIGFSELIKREIAGPMNNQTYVDYMEGIHDSGMFVLQLVNDLLDLSKIEARQYELRLEDVDINDVVNSSIELISKRAQERQIDVTCDLTRSPSSLRAETRALKQIVINLLTNAIKFTPKGGAVSVTVDLTVDNDTRLIVSDNGFGMSEKEIEVAMTAFRQVGTSSETYSEGTGLGLPLSKGLAEAHGGDLVLISTPSVGTDAILRLPLQPPTEI
jgi:PAS domain S-box-containing protein